MVLFKVLLSCAYAGVGLPGYSTACVFVPMLQLKNKG